jgi:hypothetical protein
MLDASPLEPRPARPVREYRAPSRFGIALRLVLLIAATTVVCGAAAASAFAGLLYRFVSVGR